MTDPQPPASPRLFAAHGPTLEAHRTAYGALPEVGEDLITMVQDARLSGRGGAGFPTGRKMAAVAGHKPVVIANGAEGEPLSLKDFQLLTRAPHLVLDGLDAAASAVGARKAFLYVHSGALAAVTEALAERRSAGLDPHRVVVVEAPDRFVAGEESAAIRAVEGGTAIPRDRTVVAAVSGVGGKPTLVNNVETLAHVGLIARFGSEWFRSVGDDQHPGTMLVTLSGAFHHRGVVEAPTDALLSGLVENAGGTDIGTLQAILLGGYHGSWITAENFAGTRLSRAALAPLGATPGAGIIHGLATTECGLAATAEIAAYLADQSARQCGPCLNGLPKLAEVFGQLARRRANAHVVKEVRRMTALVDGRGSCRHPDGTARMVRSALTAFAEDIESHRQRRCVATDSPADQVADPMDPVSGTYSPRPTTSH